MAEKAPSRLAKPSCLRPVSSISLKRKLLSDDDAVERAPKLLKTVSTKSNPAKGPIQKTTCASQSSLNGSAKSEGREAGKTVAHKPAAAKAPLKSISHLSKKNIPESSFNASQKPRPGTAVVKKWEPRDVVQLRKKATGTANQLQVLQEKLKQVEEERHVEWRRQEEKQQEWQVVCMQRDALQADLHKAHADVLALKNSLEDSNSLRLQLHSQLTTAQTELKERKEEVEEGRRQVAELRRQVQSMETSLHEAALKAIEEEESRKHLHNTIQELKGNIRVYGRVRPLLGEEMLGKDSELPSHMTFPDPNNKVIEVEKLAHACPNESTSRRTGALKQEFHFDRVFPPSASQEAVFQEVSQLVQSALDGYNVCIFAYGQTGSGKTYTMEGRGAGSERGVIQRSVQQVFASVHALASKGWQYEVEVSFLEIYNEVIRDLLKKDEEVRKHEVKLVGKNTTEVYVTDLTTHVVTTEEEVQVLLRQAMQARSVAETRCNDRSSRSHSVFRIKLSASNARLSETSCGTLNLVDLAGSERLKESGSQGLRLKETQSINKSLANLSNVIMALANKDSHVPYRNSKLTHLLQNCLGGSAKVLMLVNVSPSEECLQESLNSLRFASKVNQCHIGVAQKKFK